MREYVLTEKEREIIRAYLDSGVRLEGFRTLLTRCRHMEAIKTDLELIQQFLKKVES